MDRILNSVLYIKSLAKTKIKQKRMGGAPRVFLKKNKIKKKRQKEKKRMRKRGGGSLLLCGGLRCGLLGLPCRLPTLLLHREGLQLLSHVLGGVVLAGSCPRRGGTVRHCSCSHPPLRTSSPSTLCPRSSRITRRVQSRWARHPEGFSGRRKKHLPVAAAGAECVCGDPSPPEAPAHLSHPAPPSLSCTPQTLF